MIHWWFDGEILTDSGLRTCLNHIQSNFSKVPAKLETKVIQLLCQNRCLSSVVKNHIKIPHVWPLKMWNMMFQTMDKHDDFGAPPRSKIALIFGHLAKSSSLPSETSSAAMAFWGFFGPKKASKDDLMLVTVKYFCCIWCPKISSTFAESLNFMRGTSDHIG